MGRFCSSRCFRSTHRVRVIVYPSRKHKVAFTGWGVKTRFLLGILGKRVWKSSSPVEGEILSSIHFFFPYRSVWLRCGTGFFIILLGYWVRHLSAL